MDVAASIQAVLDEAVLRLTRSIAKKTGAKILCLAGGVALNCVANGNVLRDGAFENIWIQPAAGDAGGALGAALAAVHLFNNQPRKTNGSDGMFGSFLGPSFSQADIERRLMASGARFTVLSEDEMIEMPLGSRQPAGGGLVPGPHGVWSALARCTLDPRRSALTNHAAQPQFEGQVS